MHFRLNIDTVNALHLLIAGYRECKPKIQKIFCSISAEGNGNYQVEEGQCNVGTLMRIPRADVAQFMLKALGTEDYNRKCMAIASNY